MVADELNVQFIITDPDLIRCLKDISWRLKGRPGIPRDSAGAAGKFLLEALLRRPDLIDEFIDPPASKGKSGGLKRAS